MYNNERNSTNLSEGHKLPESEYTFEVKIENDVRQVYRQIQKALTTYKDEKRGKNRMLKESIFFRILLFLFIILGPTLIAVQASMDFPTLTNVMPVMSGKKLYEYFWELKGVCFTVSIIFVVQFPSFMIDKKNSQNS